MELGYDVLLEKPAAQTEAECRQILAYTKKYNRIVAICHVLRYAPYFIALKHAVATGEIGELVNIQHMEPIQYAHMAHSYVRGNWRSEKATTPIILAKSCHDLDIIRWIVDKPCLTIAADGSLHLFKKENAPEGAPLRCTDGCPHESTCPYSAIDIYVTRKQHLGVFDLKNRRDENEIMEKIKTTGYGRCVYHCDNDQPDHYVSQMTFEDGKTASFTMDAFTPWGGRRTRIMGTTGFIEGDGKTFTVYDFRSNKKKVWNMDVVDAEEYKGSGHGGGDFALVRDFIEAVATQDNNRLSSTIEASIESHIMGFAAEKSRKSNKKAKVKL
jgi:predicted dehydrogenase